MSGKQMDKWTPTYRLEEADSQPAEGRPSGVRLILKAWEWEAPGTSEDGV